MIIRTLPYTREEMKTIVQIRAKTENIKLDEEGADYLAEIGVQTSLRYGH